MNKVDAKYDQLILVCTKERQEKACCAQRGSEELFYQIKTKAASISPKIRVSKALCLGSCKTGIMVCLQPQNLWFEQVKVQDIDEIFSYVTVTNFSDDLDDLLAL